jgi:hypothetical protein
MKNFIIMALAIAMHLYAKAQHTPKQWVSGTLSNYTCDFSNGSLLTNNLNIPVQNFSTTSAAIGGTNSNLLFYTNGTAIYNNLHLKIINGDTLNPNANTLFQINAGQQLSQGAVFIPAPDDTNMFYLFHHGVDSDCFCFNFFPASCPNKFYYTLIDKSLDSGRGVALSKNNLILNDLNGHAILAVRHGNGHDWWIVVKDFYLPKWFSFLITNQGVQGPFQQTIGVASCAGYWSLKYSKLTNQVIGYKAFWEWDSLRYIDIYDFDRCTGQFNNMQTITINHKNGQIYSGACEISPSGRFLYAAVWDILYQYDLTAPNIAASRITVDSVSFNDFVFNLKRWFLMQAAPDGKIYNVSASGNNYYSVINYPDSLGVACNAVANGVLTGYHNRDLPNIPLYELGPLAGSACDTITGSPPTLKGGDMSLVVYPNPVVGKLTISSTQLSNGLKVTLTIYDMLGKVQLQQHLIVSNRFTLDISSLVSGIYFLQVKLGDKVYNVKFVKE